MTATKKPISVVTVTYNSSAVLPEMLKSVPDNIPVIVVDNGSEDAERTAAITEEYGSVFVRSNENLGFGRACNLGAALAKTELVFFLNPDAVIVEGTIAHLVRASQVYQHASAFGPAIETAKGKPFFRRSSAIDPQKSILPRGWPEDDKKVTVLSGSALAVRKRDFDAVEGFDPKIFLYHEDDDLCLRLKAQCGPIMFVKRARVVHQGGYSSGTSPTISKLKGHHMGYSRVYASLKHDKSMAFERAVLSALFELLLFPRLASPRKRAKSFGYLSGVLSARSLVPSFSSRLMRWIKK